MVRLGRCDKSILIHDGAIWHGGCVPLIDEHLAWVNREIERVRQELRVLLDIKDSYERLGESRETGDYNLPRVRRRGISITSTALEVLKEAYPEGLHVSEIWKRAQAKGAVTYAKRPASALGCSLYSLRQRGGPVEQVGPATWRWVGDDEEAIKVGGTNGD